jgi:hypothetical protein
MAQEYIQTMENFYQRADLPLQSLAVKKQALANIHYVAGMLVMAVDWLLARRHFTHSIRYYPFSLGCSQMGLRRSWLLMLRVVRFPHVFNKLLNKRLWSGVKSLLRRTT